MQKKARFFWIRKGLILKRLKYFSEIGKKFSVVISRSLLREILSS
jgi:hypothetical protein